jgi:hypothetical protein
VSFDPRLPAAPRSRIAGFALGLSAFSAIVCLYALILLRTRAVEASAAYSALLSGFALAGAAILAGVVALVVVWRTGRTGGVRAFFAIALAAAVLGGPAYVAASNFGAPRINDATTDLADPPRFERAARDRGPGDNAAPPALIPPEQAAAQRDAYPDLAPLRLALPPEDVANLAAGLVDDREWRVIGRTSFPRGGGPTGRIEAVARSPVLGLESDVAIRVRADAEGSRVDMRSASRVGAGDFGANAARIRSFLADLTAAANAAP